MKILIIDNYDSFTFNLFHLIEAACGNSDTIDIISNDSIKTERVRLYDRIIISPGPGVPSQAGGIIKVIGEVYDEIPLLGICLGHQAIAETFGATLSNFDAPIHGIKSTVLVDNKVALFRGLPERIEAGRYHSWTVAPNSIPPIFKVSAWDEDGNIMAISHTEHNLHGIQFHPESFMTRYGVDILTNFLYSRKP